MVGLLTKVEKAKGLAQSTSIDNPSKTGIVVIGVITCVGLLDKHPATYNASRPSVVKPRGHNGVLPVVATLVGGQ
jgi:hypothetical protein